MAYPSWNDKTKVLPPVVDGIRLDGSEVTVVRNIPIAPPMWRENHPVPVMLQSGIPVYARKEPRTPEKIKSFSICRVMSDPDLGSSQALWQDFPSYPAPTLLFRPDGIPFTPVDYSLVDDFERAMIKGKPRMVTPHDWITFATARRSNSTEPEFRPPKCFLLDEHYTNPPKHAPLISDDTVRTLYLGGNSTHLRTPEGHPRTGKLYGVRVYGEKLEPVKVPMGGESVSVVIAKLVGLPIRAHLRRKSPRESRSLFRITRLMEHPITGKLSKRWEEPRDIDLRGLWPTHVFRNDGVPFTVFDFFVLDKFWTWVHHTKPSNVSERLWEKWMKDYIRRHDNEGVSIARSVLMTEAKFPTGTRVRAKKLLKNTNLNGRVGVVAHQVCVQIGRIRLRFPDRPNPVSIKVDNVELESVNAKGAEKAKQLQKNNSVPVEGQKDVVPGSVVPSQLNTKTKQA